MREILFKAKRIDNEEWVEGSYLYCEKATTVSFRNEHYMLVFDGYGVAYHEIDKDTICQFTGLYDKNGNKIWENDVVRDVDEDMIVVVRWDEEKLRFVLDYYGTKGCLMEYGWDECMGEFDVVDTYGFDDFCSPINESLEVIGTKFDNPELLGG